LDVPTFRGRDVVLANVDKFHTLACSQWQKLLPQDLFDVVIVDEAHHLPSDKWRNVVEFFQPSKLLFLTATPYRAKGGSIVAELCPPLCNGQLLFHFKLLQAIEMKQIKQPKFDNLKQAPNDPTVRVLTQVAQKLSIQNQNRQLNHRYQGMVLALDREDAENMLEMWQNNRLDQHASIAVYHGDRKERHLTLDRFRRRDIDVLIVVQMLKEGFDHPPVSVIGIARRVQSSLLFTQFIGRAFRIVRQQDRTPDPQYDQIATIISAEEFNQQQNWDSFIEEKLIPTVDD